MQDKGIRITHEELSYADPPASSRHVNVSPILHTSAQQHDAAPLISPAGDRPDASHPLSAHTDSPNWRLLRLASVLIGISATLLFIGICSPSFTMIPSMGGGFFEWLVSSFVDDLTPRSFSLASGLIKLFTDGEFALGSIILAFSVVFPLTKLIVLTHCVAGAFAAQRHPLALAWINHLGKWSMLDVFVLGIIVVAHKSFPGGSRVVVNWGMYVFGFSVVLSMLGAWATNVALRPTNGGEDSAHGRRK